MPDVDLNGSAAIINGRSDSLKAEESNALQDWDPKALIKALYEISYEPRVETKRNRFITMEGHVEVLGDDTTKSDGSEAETWIKKYIRTKEGRLQIFATHYAGEAPATELILSGADVEANKDQRTLRIHGGREHVKYYCRVPSALFDKWRQSFLSNCASSQIDAFVKPFPGAFQHLTKRILIIELGSCSIRAGVLTNEVSLPQSFFPSIAVRLPDGTIVAGEDAYRPDHRRNGDFVKPIQAVDPLVDRYSIDKDVLKAIFEKIVKDLKIEPFKYKVLLSISQNFPSSLIIELLQICLNEIKFQAAAITRQPSLTLYAYDVTTGVVVDIGERLNIVPVIDGYVVESAICSIPYGSQQMGDALRASLSANNKGLYSFQSPVEKLILRYVMEQTTYVPDDYQKEEKSENRETRISLEGFRPTPGMQTKFDIDNSRFLCTEGLFKPKKWGLDTKGLHQLIHEAILQSPIDSRRTLYRNIYLAGGASLMPGLAEKLEQELSTVVPSSIHTQVNISPWRYNAAYLGAQIVASASTFEDSCITSAELPKFLQNLQNSTL